LTDRRQQWGVEEKDMDEGAGKSCERGRWREMTIPSQNFSSRMSEVSHPTALRIPISPFSSPLIPVALSQARMTKAIRAAEKRVSIIPLRQLKTES